jgi:hypothetical protein
VDILRYEPPVMGSQLFVPNDIGGGIALHSDDVIIIKCLVELMWYIPNCFGAP